jgi:hypothetical protein
MSLKIKRRPVEGKERVTLVSLSGVVTEKDGPRIRTEL